jgi:hypothetical protein
MLQLYAIFTLGNTTAFDPATVRSCLYVDGKQNDAGPGSDGSVPGGSTRPPASRCDERTTRTASSRAMSGLVMRNDPRRPAAAVAERSTSTIHVGTASDVSHAEPPPYGQVPAVQRRRHQDTDQASDQHKNNNHTSQWKMASDGRHEQQPSATIKVVWTQC